MHYRYKVYTRRLLLATGIGLLALVLSPLMFYGWRCLLRPSRTDMEQVLFRGIVYKRHALSTPRPAMLHIVTIDLQTPGIKPLVTPGAPKPSDRETSARKTSDFLNEYKLQLAINASYFHLNLRKGTPATPGRLAVMGNCGRQFAQVGKPAHATGSAIEGVQCPLNCQDYIVSQRRI